MSLTPSFCPSVSQSLALSFSTPRPFFFPTYETGPAQGFVLMKERFSCHCLGFVTCTKTMLTVTVPTKVNAGYSSVYAAVVSLGDSNLELSLCQSLTRLSFSSAVVRPVPSECLHESTFYACSVVPGLPTLLIAGDVLEKVYLTPWRGLNTSLSGEGTSETGVVPHVQPCAALSDVLMKWQQKNKRQKNHQDMWINTFYPLSELCRF